ncbi:hypothetical protein NMY22_g3192 [Coprinellus aureogranulatus]|nr:hypothetical protein NMY22_g3192 [Coprinellus aureogranulatus]
MLAQAPDEDPTVPTSAPYLPSEIVSLTVQHVRAGAHYRKKSWEQDLRNLSLVRRDFTDPCQEALLETVVLGPGPVRRNGVKHNGFQLMDRFCELITEQPRLATYVRALYHTFPQGCAHIGDKGHKAKAASALEKLTQVKFLSIAYEGPEEGDSENRFLDWELCRLIFAETGRYAIVLKALEKLLSGENIKKLALRNIRIPGEVIVRAKALKKIHLEGTAQCSEGYVRLEPLRVEHLALTGGASYEMAPSLAPAYWKRYPISFSDLKSVVTDFGGDSYSERTKEMILQQATGLHTLHLSTPARYPLRPSKRMKLLVPLNPSSFATLTVLHIDIVFNITDPSQVIRDPWQGLCDNHKTDNVLHKLKALERLTIRIWISGPAWKSINVDANFTDPVWRKLDYVLVPSDSSTPLPQLEFVELTVGVDGNCRSAPERAVKKLLPKVLGCARSVPWMKRVARKAKKGEIEMVLQARGRHRDCNDAWCMYL